MANRHAGEPRDGVVVKRLRSWDQGEHLREWRALTLLARVRAGPRPRVRTGRSGGDPAVRGDVTAGRDPAHGAGDVRAARPAGRGPRHRAAGGPVARPARPAVSAAASTRRSRRPPALVRPL